MVDEYLERIGRALALVEARLERRLSLADLAGEACFAPFYFSRIFASLVGMTVEDYVRGRRLTRAAQRLLHERIPIVDLASASGFGSQEAFTRAFKRRFAMTPARYRMRGARILKGSLEPLSREDLRSRLSGGISMEPRIVEAGPIRVTGLRCSNTASRITIPALWFRFLRRMRSITEVADGSTYGVYLYDYSVPTSDITEEIPFDYLAGMGTLPSSVPPKGMEALDLPAARYAVFSFRGRLARLGMAYQYIYSAWFASSGETPAPAAHFERHGPDYPGDREDAVTEIWVPLVRTP